MIAANYTAHFYCDCDGCTSKQWGSPDFGEFIGNSWSQCAREARKSGWRISSDRTRCFAPGHKICRAAGIGVKGE
ncbi:TPA: hypothetical protein ACWH67_003381 [Salmonella enterica]|uniref:hypothetical protein n=1 Tax=Citrobacter TaxID=544 RepID=UPI001F2B0266|nr:MULTISPECIES: hypothetical protein [Citrobacter]MDM2828057.1 hypothetical protein [Citrobacter sp. Cpo089]